MPHQEWHDENGLLLPSVTEVIGLYCPKELQEWRGRVGNKEADRIMNEAAALGSEVHALIEEALERGEPLACEEGQDSRPYELAARVFEWTEKQKLKVIGKELGLLNTVDGYGGTPDLIGLLGGNAELWMIDWKTSGSIHETYRLQLAAYARSYNLSRGLSWADGINRGCIVRPQKRFPERPPEVKKYMNLDLDFQAFEGLLKLWKFLNGRPPWGLK